MSKYDPVVITVEILRETEKAFLVTDGFKEDWIPKSQIDFKSSYTTVREVGETGDLEIPEWLAEKKPFSYDSVENLIGDYPDPGVDDGLPF